MLASDHACASEEHQSAGRQFQHVVDTHHLTLGAKRSYRCNFLWLFVRRARISGRALWFRRIEEGLIFEQPHRMLAVDEAHERGMDAVAEHALNVLAALLHRLAR